MKSAEEKLTITNIGGTAFQLDVAERALRELSRPDNLIPFHLMKDHVDFYTMDYHLGSKNFPTTCMDDEQIVKVRVKKMVELDPEGMASYYGVERAGIENRTDLEVVNDQTLLAARLKEKMPVFHICDYGFRVYLALNELRGIVDPSVVLPISALYAYEIGEKNACYYHVSSRSVWHFEPGVTELPEGVVKLVLPDRLQLDPVGAARLFGLDDSELLRHFPIRKGLAARVVPFDQTDLPGIVRRNQKLKERKHQVRRSARSGS